MHAVVTGSEIFVVADHLGRLVLGATSAQFLADFVVPLHLAAHRLVPVVLVVFLSLPAVVHRFLRVADLAVAPCHHQSAAVADLVAPESFVHQTIVVLYFVVFDSIAVGSVVDPDFVDLGSVVDPDFVAVV